MRYRKFVIHKLPKIEFLDASPVTAEERKEAARSGHLSGVARAEEDDSAQIYQARSQKERMGAAAAKPVKSQAFLAKVRWFSFCGWVLGSIDCARRVGNLMISCTPISQSKPRYDGSNSEGNRFIMNDDL